jgi:hypothetical protein
VTAPLQIAVPVDTIDFLRDLRQNNDRAWFESNRARSEAGYLEQTLA